MQHGEVWRLKAGRTAQRRELVGQAPAVTPTSFLRSPGARAAWCAAALPLMATGGGRRSQPVAARDRRATRAQERHLSAPPAVPRSGDLSHGTIGGGVDLGDPVMAAAGIWVVLLCQLVAPSTNSLPVNRCLGTYAQDLTPRPLAWTVVLDAGERVARHRRGLALELEIEAPDPPSKRLTIRPPPSARCAATARAPWRYAIPCRAWCEHGALGGTDG
jgi:hypothetical protein